MLDHLSKADVAWLLGEYNQVRNYGKVKIDDHIRAISLLRNKNISKPGCTCEYPAYGRMANDLFEQHKSILEEMIK